MKFTILTIFPKIFDSYFNESILKRAQKKGYIHFNILNIRDFARDKHKTVDDKPYGGGPGMIMKVEPIYKALRALKSSKFKVQSSKLRGRSATILLSAAGKIFTQNDAARLAKYDSLIFICGRYEGVDERVKKFVDEEISIGEYVLTGGELPAMVIIDAVTRLIPGVIKPESLLEESFAKPTQKKLKIRNLAICPVGAIALSGTPRIRATPRIGKLEIVYEYPQYTRPEIFKYQDSKTGKIRFLKVPKVLLSGNHQKINEWRRRHLKT